MLYRPTTSVLLFRGETGRGRDETKIAQQGAKRVLSRRASCIRQRCKQMRHPLLVLRTKYLNPRSAHSTSRRDWRPTCPSLTRAKLTPSAGSHHHHHHNHNFSPHLVFHASFSLAYQTTSRLFLLRPRPWHRFLIILDSSGGLLIGSRAMR